MDKVKLIDDALFVHDAAGSALSKAVLGRLFEGLRTKGVKASGARAVVHPAQTQAYMLMGYSFSIPLRGGWQKRTEDGLAWSERMDMPPDVLLLEAEEGHGVVINLSTEGLDVGQ